jgi:hypothetical protein
LSEDYLAEVRKTLLILPMRSVIDVEWRDGLKIDDA